jgi:hypothetical protein
VTVSSNGGILTGSFEGQVPMRDFPLAVQPAVKTRFACHFVGVHHLSPFR